jgi:hypothetical protein
MRLLSCVLLATTLCACEKPAAPIPAPAAPPTVATARDLGAPDQASAQDAEADAAPTDLYIAHIPGDASDGTWELRRAGEEVVKLPEAVQRGMSHALTPAIAGPTGGLLLYDEAGALVVFDLKTEASVRALPLEEGAQLLSYGASTSAEHIFAVTRVGEGPTMLYVAPSAGGEQPVSIKINPHTPCSSRCSTPSVYFADERTIRYRVATSDGEQGDEVEVKLP